MNLENATPVEVLWTVIALLGVLGCLWLAREAVQDLHEARRLDPLTTLIGVTTIVIVNLVGISLTILLLIGVRAMLLPPSAATVDRGSLLAGGGLVILGICQIGIVVTKTWQRIESRRIHDHRSED